MGKFALQLSPFHREHTLVITPDCIEYDNGKTLLSLPKNDIVDVKHVTETITWGGAVVGRRFNVVIKSVNNSTLDVVFNSYLSLKPEYIRTYFKIVRNLWDYYLRDLAEQKRERFNNGETLIFGKVKVSQKGIEAPAASGLSIAWGKLSLQEERSFFVLSNNDNTEQSIRITFNDWGSEILCCLIGTILKHPDDSTLSVVETPARVRDSEASIFPGR